MTTSAPLDSGFLRSLNVRSRSYVTVRQEYKNKPSGGVIDVGEGVWLVGVAAQPGAASAITPWS
jgi:hypothetical protein